MSAPFGRRGLALLLVAVTALAAGSATPAADRHAVKQLTVAGLGQGTGLIRSRVMTRPARRLAGLPATAWGGVYTTKSGARVTVYSSNQYPVDPAANQSAADFIDRLVHGTEIASVKIYFAPPAEVGTLCQDTEVDGCYFVDSSEIITIGEDTPWSTVEEVLTHEYGHHIAAKRNNYPWPAFAYGTKRWATYMGVCQKEAAGTAFPGDQGEHYLQNPGEAFAESYLHLNEVKLGVPETPWFYDAAFKPDSGALAAIEADVLQPWKDNKLKRWAGRFSRRGQQKAFTFSTPLDGVFAVELRGPRGSTLTLTGGAEIKRLSPRLSAALVCGQRSVAARFVAGAKGRFGAATSTP
jgi:hypothetical protein